MNQAAPALRDAMRVWLRIGLLSFGGPAGQIALLHREIVEQSGWVGERRFLHALSFCTLLPGPEATQLATYLGWLLNGPAGGVAACLLFILPGATLLLALSALYVTAAHLPAIEGLFYGLKCAVLALVVQALLRIGRRALKTRAAWVLAALAFLSLFVFALPYPALICAAGCAGALAPSRFGAPSGADGRDAPADLIDMLHAADPARRGRLERGARRAGIAALALWLLPLATLSVFARGRFADIAWFFSKMAVVTLGGAYAVLAYVAQDAVRYYHWLSAPEMITGLGLAETTPGPLILVLQFVGFLAGARAAGPLHGMAGGVAASALTLWVTFLPSLAFVFFGAPLVERLAENLALRGALAAITASIVGVIANLTAWFALHALFATMHPVSAGLASFDLPVASSLDPVAAIIAFLAALGLFRLRLSVPAVLGLAAGSGLLLRLSGI
jgi:chromate transporter